MIVGDNPGFDVKTLIPFGGATNKNGGISALRSPWCVTSRKHRDLSGFWDAKGVWAVAPSEILSEVENTSVRLSDGPCRSMFVTLGGSSAGDGPNGSAPVKGLPCAAADQALIRTGMRSVFPGRCPLRPGDFSTGGFGDRPEVIGFKGRAADKTAVDVLKRQ